MYVTYLYFRIYLRQYIYALSYQYFQFMYIACIYLSYHCLGWYTVRIWVFVCVCCAAPDKLTSPPPFTGFGALHYVIQKVHPFGAVDLIHPEGRTFKVNGQRLKPYIEGYKKNEEELTYLTNENSGDHEPEIKS